MFAELLKQYGLSIALIGVIGWFLGYKVWPLIEKAWEDYKDQLRRSQEARDSALAQFDKALERRDAKFDIVVQALQDLSSEIRTRRK